ncbi:MAG: hypothetical protein ACLVG5_02220 [Clostridium sp.]
MGRQGRASMDGESFCLSDKKADRLGIREVHVSGHDGERTFSGMEK